MHVSSRKEQKQRLGAERLERERAAAAAAAKRRRLGQVAAAVLGVAVLVAAVAVLASGGSPAPTGGGGSWPSGSVPAQRVHDLNAATKSAGCVLTNPKSEGAGHTESPVKYKSQPPTSGSHYPVPAHDAAYLQAPKPYESLVHALEHGRVVYWFKPSAPAAVKGALKKLYDEDDKLVVLTANPRPMPYEVAATAWTRLLGCRAYNHKVPDAMRAFRDAYRLKGPEYFPNAE